MFGLSSILEDAGRHENKEEEGSSQFFTFQPEVDNAAGNGNSDDFKVEGHDYSGVELNETTTNSFLVSPFNLFEKKPEIEKIRIEETSKRMGTTMDTEPSFMETSLIHQESKNKNISEIHSPGKSAKPYFPPWKTSGDNINAEDMVGSKIFEGNTDEPMDQVRSVSEGAIIPVPVQEIVESVTPVNISTMSTNDSTSKMKESEGCEKERWEIPLTSMDCGLQEFSSVSPSSKLTNVRRQLFAGVTPKKCPENIEADKSGGKGEDIEIEKNLDCEIRGNPSEFISSLRNRFGSTEEFDQFERYFYSQVEEVRMLRGNVEGLRSSLVKNQEEKRVLELQLVSERALRDQESKNFLMNLEKNNMQLNTQIYSMKCEVETWKRKAEATLKESGWLKQQLKSLELEKTEAVRKHSELSRQHNGFEQYKISIEAYARRQREAMTDIQKKILDLEKARENLVALTNHNQKQMNLMAVHLKNRENHRSNSEKRMGALEEDLIKTRAELVQNNAKLVRVQTCQTNTAELLDKLVTENKDLHLGISLLVSTMQNNVGETNINFLNRIGKIHEEVEESIRSLRVNDCP